MQYQVLASLLPLLALTGATPVPGTVADVPSGVEPKTTADNLDLIVKLKTAATATDRLALLKNEDFVFDFNNPAASDATTRGNGGHTVKADSKGFPALIGTGVGMTLGFLGPCGFNTPHTHPRSSEINVVVDGELVAEMIPENGAKLVRNHLSRYQVTVFPKGALHTEFNPGCSNATFVAGFSDEDPGVQQAAQTFLGLDDEILQATLYEGRSESFKGEDIAMLRNMVPKNVALGVESCLRKCNISLAGKSPSATASSTASSTSAASSTATKY